MGNHNDQTSDCQESYTPKPCLLKQVPGTPQTRVSVWASTGAGRGQKQASSVTVGHKYMAQGKGTTKHRAHSTHTHTHTSNSSFKRLISSWNSRSMASLGSCIKQRTHGRQVEACSCAHGGTSMGGTSQSLLASMEDTIVQELVPYGNGITTGCCMSTHPMGGKLLRLAHIQSVMQGGT